jgi:hypothetical protein
LDNKRYPKQLWLIVALYLCLSATDPCIWTYITQGTIGLLDENISVFCVGNNNWYGIEIRPIKKMYCFIKNYKMMGTFFGPEKKMRRV